MKAHLLYRDRDFDFSAELPEHCPDLVQDLELTTVLDAMAAGDRFLAEVVRAVVLTSLTDPEEIVYRQRVLADSAAAPDVVRQMYDLVTEALREKRGLWGLTSQSPASILAGALGQLEAFVGWLHKLRGIADEHADRFCSEGMRNLFDGLKQDLDDEYFAVVSGHLQQLRFRRGELLSARLGRDNTGVDYVLRSTAGESRGWREHLGLAPRSTYSFTIPPRDDAGAQAVAEIAARGLNSVANAVAQSADHIGSYFTMLRAELGFYVACLNLRDRLSTGATPLSYPVPVRLPTKAFGCRSLCDAALALRLNGAVVGNDVEADGKSLVIVTGANSGGKSTFLRSVGLAQLMLQAGMFVVAESYRASVHTAVFTHFIREEDSTMASGRLDEELARMSMIVDRLDSGGLLLFNESFAATNEREGSEIGRQVVRALLEAGLAVFFVTHQYDFAHSFWVQERATTHFLRAERDRTYRLVPAEPLPTSFGQDLYYRLGGWLEEEPGRPRERP